MAKNRVEPGFDEDRSFETRDPSIGMMPDPSRVLVVGNSQINRIVVARIVEKAGLKPVTETPVTAVRILPLLFPGLVVLDGGADNRDCDALTGGIAALRRISGKDLPAVVLLSNRTGDPDTLSLPGVIDAVVTKPFTSDQLQPVVERLLERARG